MKRRHFFAATAALAAPAWATAATPSPTPVDLWKSPTCGCCQDWVNHLEAHGFSVRVHDTGNTAMRARLRIPQALGSCHTALVGGYAIEGHVPAEDIRRLLAERPQAVGLAVPGMPIGSPGMDGPAYGNRSEPYDVLLVKADAPPSVFRAVR